MRDSTRYEKVETAPGITGDGLFGPYKFIRLASGRKIIFSDAIREAESAHSKFVRGISRSAKLMGDESSWDLDMLERQLSQMEEYCAAVRHFLAKKQDEKVVREKIAALRNTEGRTPEEAALYAAKADQLEAALHG